MRGKSHNPDLQAQVMAALLAGQGVNEVARAFNLDPSVVSRWRQRLPPDQLQQLAIDGELRNNLAVNGKKFVIENYSYFRLVKETENLYKFLLN